jgi:hypothetical protein
MMPLNRAAVVVQATTPDGRVHLSTSVPPRISTAKSLNSTLHLPGTGTTIVARATIWALQAAAPVSLATREKIHVYCSDLVIPLPLRHRPLCRCPLYTVLGHACSDTYTCTFRSCTPGTQHSPKRRDALSCKTPNGCRCPDPDTNTAAAVQSLMSRFIAGPPRDAALAKAAAALQRARVGAACRRSSCAACRLSSCCRSFCFQPASMARWHGALDRGALWGALHKNKNACERYYSCAQASAYGRPVGSRRRLGAGNK